MGSPLAIYELRLLKCLLGGSEASDSEAQSVPDKPAETLKQDSLIEHGACSSAIVDDAIRTVVDYVEQGAFFDALSAKPVRLLLWGPHARSWEPVGPDGIAEDFYKALGFHISSFLSVGGERSSDHGCNELIRSRALLVMAVGVAALLAFVQANVTGPLMTYPPCSLILMSREDQRIDEKEWNTWAKRQLMVDGCDLSGTCALPEYLILAKLLLVDTFEATDSVRKGGGAELVSRSWWACRVLLAHQQILAERSPSLYAALTVVSTEILKQLGSTKAVLEVEWGSDMYNEIAIIIVTSVHLEAGFVEYTYGHIDNARQLFEAAKEACGLQLSITGVLGFRTAHQVDPKPQMVLVAKTKSTPADQQPSEVENFCTTTKRFSLGGEKKNSDSSTEDDILMVPRLVEGVKEAGIPVSDENGGWSEQKVLSSVQQAVILAQCLDIKKSNPDDELKGWQMAPFIEAVDTQQDYHFMVKCCCQLLRIRWEGTRSRTRQRALLMMEQLVEEIRGSSCKVADRMHYSFCVHFPTIPVLLKEYAELMVSCGLIGDALRVFEELELWNNLIDCYCLLEKKAAATDLIKERLQSQPKDPRLWCALGDVTLNEECYIKAWEVSGHRFARAQRSLGQSAYNKGEYAKSMEHWEAALALNSLHPGGWFALGSAALKARELNKALDSFSRAVQFDPENGEAWNNIAAIHMIKKRSKEAFTAFREALKFRRHSWQMWENYAQVALDIGNFGQAVEAMQMVLDLSQGKRIDLKSLTKLVEEVEARSGSKKTGVAEDCLEMKHNISSEGTECAVRSDSTSIGVAEGSSVEMKFNISNEGMGCAAVQSESHASQEIHFFGEEQQSKETEWLIERAGKLLSWIVHNGQGGGVWGLLARWHRAKGDLTMCSEALLKQVRALQGSDWQCNRERFQTFCQASLQLCEVYMDIALKTGSKRELYSAQMHLRNTIKQGERFSDTDDYMALESCLTKIQLTIQAAK